jgi:hypothetical protein
MAAGIPMRALTKAQIDLAFTLHADSVCEGAYYKNGATLFKSSVKFLVFPVPPGDCDGSVLKAGDQRMLVRESGLGQDFQPASGDYVQCGCGNTKYGVLSGALDFTASVWTLYCRRRCD